MDKNLKNYINEMFNSIGYIDVMKIAKYLNLDVFGGDLQEKNSFIRKSQINNQYQIYVNYKHSKQRQRFSIAHEIGHFLLHRDKIDNTYIVERSGKSSLTLKQEREADKIAVDILTPKDLVNNYLESLDISLDTKIDIVVLDKFIKKFNISKQFALIRLKELGYFIEQSLWQ